MQPQVQCKLLWFLLACCGCNSMRLARKAALVALESVVVVGELRVLSKWRQEKRCISMLAQQVLKILVVLMAVAMVLARVLAVAVVVPLMYVATSLW
jgi:hypothetical protein